MSDLPEADSSASVDLTISSWEDLPATRFALLPMARISDVRSTANSTKRQSDSVSPGR
jgi:hypothetical protein